MNLSSMDHFSDLISPSARISMRPFSEGEIVFAHKRKRRNGGEIVDIEEFVSNPEIEMRKKKVSWGKQTTYYFENPESQPETLPIPCITRSEKRYNDRFVRLSDIFGLDFPEGESIVVKKRKKSCVFGDDLLLETGGIKSCQEPEGVFNELEFLSSSEVPSSDDFPENNIDSTFTFGDDTDCYKMKLSDSFDSEIETCHHEVEDSKLSQRTKSSIDMQKPNDQEELWKQFKQASCFIFECSSYVCKLLEEKLYNCMQETRNFLQSFQQEDLMGWIKHFATILSSKCVDKTPFPRVNLNENKLTICTQEKSRAGMLYRYSKTTAFYKCDGKTSISLNKLRKDISNSSKAILQGKWRRKLRSRKGGEKNHKCSNKSSCILNRKMMIINSRSPMKKWYFWTENLGSQNLSAAMDLRNARFSDFMNEFSN